MDWAKDTNTLWFCDAITKIHMFVSCVWSGLHFCSLSRLSIFYCCKFVKRYLCGFQTIFFFILVLQLNVECWRCLDGIRFLLYWIQLRGMIHMQVSHSFSLFFFSFALPNWNSTIFRTAIVFIVRCVFLVLNDIILWTPNIINADDWRKKHHRISLFSSLNGQKRFYFSRSFSFYWNLFCC